MTHATYDSYKESGVPWLGKVPTGWEVKPLKHLVDYNSESLPETTDPELLIKYVDISSVNLIEGITKIEEIYFENAPSRARRIVRNGDTIISTVRTYLKAITAIRNPKDNMIVSTGFAVIRPKKDMNPDYLGYFLKSDGFIGEVVSKSIGVSYPAVNATDLVCIESLLPPFAEQKAIAEFLDNKTAQIDALIAKKKNLLKLLAEQRTALITNTVTRGLDDSAPMKESGITWLGKVPKGWILAPLKYGLSIKNGREHKEIESDSGYPVMGSGGRFSYATKYLYDGEAVLLGRKGTIDKPLYINEKFWAVDTMFYGIPSKKCCGKFLYYCATRIPFALYATDTALPSMTQTSLGNHPVAFPPLAEQKEITHFLDCKTAEIDATKDRIKTAIDTLKEYRTALITNAVTGKIKVV